MISSNELRQFYENRLHTILTIQYNMIVESKELSSTDKIELLEMMRSIIEIKDKKTKGRRK